jgi:hypothetical protein
MLIWFWMVFCNVSHLFPSVRNVALVPLWSFVVTLFDFFQRAVESATRDVTSIPPCGQETFALRDRPGEMDAYKRVHRSMGN